MLSSQPAERGDGQSSFLAGVYSPSQACLHLAGLAIRKQKKIRLSPDLKVQNEGKNEFEIMEDVFTLVLVIVLCLLFKPLIAAILRGMGSSEHRRDR